MQDVCMVITTMHTLVLCEHETEKGFLEFQRTQHEFALLMDTHNYNKCSKAFIEMIIHVRLDTHKITQAIEQLLHCIHDTG